MRAHGAAIARRSADRRCSCKLTGGSGTAGDRRDRLMVQRAVPVSAAAAPAGRRATARGGASAATARAAMLFGGVGLAVVRARCSSGAFWLTRQLADYAELGDYLLRLGLSWLFLTFLSFLAFSGVVTALSTFFLSDDLRLLLAAPVAARRLFHARFAAHGRRRRRGWSSSSSCRCWSASASRAARRSSFYADRAADGGAVRRSSRSRPARR